MNIKKTFLKLTKRTYPHGSEHRLYHMLPKKLQKDEFGNLFMQIGDSTSVMFTSHLDTATMQDVKIKHVIEGNIIKTDGKSILGADDKAGVTVMLYMIHNKVPGLYYFFLGEERGCIGSKKLAKKFEKDKLENITKVISFDRRALSSIITHQSSRRCCSDAFTTELARQLNTAEESFSYKADPTGSYTDSYQFISIYPECTNISVGYYSEHMNSEKQDIDHLDKLAKACVKVDWESLPVERDYTKTEYSYSSSYGGWDDYDWYGGAGVGGGYGPRWNKSNFEDTYNRNSSYVTNKYGTNINPNSQLVDVKKHVSFHDVKYNFVSTWIVNKFTDELMEVKMSPERIQYETDLIERLITILEVPCNSMFWDGVKLAITHFTEIQTVTRKELEEYLEELSWTHLSSQYNEEEDIFGKPTYY